MRSFVAGGVALLCASLSGVTYAVDLKQIEARASLRVLVSADEQPEMFALTPAAPAPPGFEREILEGFARTHRCKLELVTVQTFDQIIPMLLKEDGDVIVGIIDTESRRRQISFTIETLPARHLAVNRKPQPPLATLDDFRKVKVGVITGTSWAEAAAAAGVKGTNTVSFPDLPQVLEALQSGRVSATVMSAPDFALAQRHDPSLQAGPFLGPPSRAAWGVRKSDPGLLASLNDYIFNMRSSPAWGQLVGRYFTPDALDLFKRARSTGVR